MSKQNMQYVQKLRGWINDGRLELPDNGQLIVSEVDGQPVTELVCVDDSDVGSRVVTTGEADEEQ